ncbi:MAG: hypothetical protein LRS48_04425 [Desulfurococcales archaeon]|nr:hypothetical protein [Desulfurococcales archaeon]
MNRLSVVLVSLLLVIAFSAIYNGMLTSYAATNTTTNTTTTATSTTNTTVNLNQLVNEAFSNPQTGAVILIEFLLGVGLGYTAVKALKYILAFIGILLLGSALSVWSIGSNSKDIAAKLGVEVKQLLPLIKSTFTMLGAMVVGPASIGVIVGIIIGAIKK